MKNIQAQYQDLLEGKMSKANFMRNVRMQFPQYISAVNSFDDSVRVLKGKRILSESHDANTNWLENFYSELEKRGVENDPEVKAALDRLGAAGLIDVYGMFQHPFSVNAFLSDLPIDDPQGAEEDERIDHLRKGSKELEENDGPNFRSPVDVATIVAGKHADKLNPLRSNFKEFQSAALQLAGEEMLAGGMPKTAIRNLLSGYGYFEDWIQDFIDALSDKLKTSEGGLEELNEAEKKAPSIDHVDYLQLTRGTEFELSKMRVLSDENYLKAKERAYKKLVKNPNAYRHLMVANYAEVEKKDKVLKPQEVKKSELGDKPNQMKTLKKDATANTKDNLGKKEKRKGVPEGVKQLKEEMLREFGGDAIPEIKKKFAKGHEVVTPEGKVGHIEELTHDNTATIVYEDGTKEDFQENVLKTVEEVSDERDISSDETKPSPAFLKFSREKDAEERAAKDAAEEYKGIKKKDKVELDDTKVNEKGAQELGLEFNKIYTVQHFIVRNKGKFTENVDAVLDNGKQVEVGNLKLAEAKPFGTVGKLDLGKSFGDIKKNLAEKLVQAMKEELYDDPTSTTDKPIVATSPQSKNALKRAGMKEIPGTKDVK